jgi:integrase
MARDGIRLRPRRRSYSIQVAVPADLVGRVLGPSGKPVKIVERSLHTSDSREARDKGVIERGRIAEMFRTIRAGLPVPDVEVQRIAEEEMRRAFDLLSADFLTHHPHLDKYAAEIAELSEFDLDAAIQPSPIFSGVPTHVYAESRLRQLGRKPTGEEILALSVTILRAHGAAVAAVKGGHTPPPLPGRSAVVRRGPGTAPRILDIAERCIADRTSLTQKTRDHIRSSMRLLSEHCDDCHFDALDRATVASWVQGMVGRGLAPGTVNAHRSKASSVWQWAQDNGLIADTAASPFTRLWRKVSDESMWVPFTMPELQKLVKPSPIRWAILAALFSGMRASEIVGAKVEKHGKTWCFIIGKGKTASAKRIIPLHPTLLKLGFLEHHGVLAGLSLLSKKFTRWRRTQGITEERKKLHSLRKNFVEALERAGVPDSTISLLVGHKGKRGFTLSRYSPAGPGLKMLAAAVAKVSYKGLRLGAGLG